MNISTLNYCQNGQPLKNPSSSRNRPDFSLAFDPEDRKTDHTNVKNPRFQETFWDASRSLPKAEQISLAASALSYQLFQNGITDKNKDFIKSFQQKFSPTELNSVKTLMKSNSYVGTRAFPKMENLMAELEQLWSDTTKKAQDPKVIPQDNPRPRSPNEIFFQTTFEQNQRRVKAAFSL